MQIKRRGLILIFLPVIFLLHSGFLETTSGLNRKGNKAFQEKRYQTALDAYQKAQVKNPDHPTVRYNVGTTLYQMDQFQEAEPQLAQALAHAKTKELKALAYYNDGNTQYRLGQFDKAIESYRKALDLNPNDKDAKYNLELLQKKKSMFEIKQDKRDENRKNQPPPSQQDRQDQQQSQGKDKKDQQAQNQDQKEEQPSQGQEDEKEQEKKEGSEQDQSQKQDQKDEQKSEPGEGQESQAPQEEGKDQKNEQWQPLQPEEREGSQDEKPKEGQGEQLKPLFQGQMSKENALGILDALKSSEQELQSLRRPRQQAEHEPLKDW